MTKGLHKLRVKRLTMKRLNIVKQLKKTSKGRQFSKNFKGKVIDGVHELYTLTAGMMLGIRCSVSDEYVRRIIYAVCIYVHHLVLHLLYVKQF